MQISNISTSYLLKELQSGAGLNATTASGAGQNPPSDIDGADSSSTASSLKAADLGSSQFAADTLSSLLSVQTSPGSKLASTLIGSLDGDGDGALSQDEVAKAVGSSSSDISDKFAKLDSDGDGKLSQDELSSALDSAIKSSGGPQRGHHHHGGMAKQEASDLVSQLDTNGDGTVSLDELNAGAGTAAASTTGASSTTTDTATDAAASTTAATTTTTTTGSSDLAKTFASADANGDGQLSMDELTKAFAQAMAQQHRFAKPFWEAAAADPSTTTSATQSVTA